MRPKLFLSFRLLVVGHRFETVYNDDLDNPYEVTAKMPEYADQPGVALVNIDKAEQVRAFGHPRAVRDFGLFSDDKRMLTGSDDKLVRLWEIETGRELAVGEGHTGPVFFVGFGESGHRAVSVCSQCVIVWELPP